MKIKAYDKYNKQWIMFEPLDDKLWNDYCSSNRGVDYKVNLRFSALEGDKDNCSPERWSDLEKFEIIK